METLVYAILDPGSSSMRMARAGHPYPLLLHPERGPSFLTGAHGPALGMGA